IRSSDRCGRDAVRGCIEPDSRVAALAWAGCARWTGRRSCGVFPAPGAATRSTLMGDDESPDLFGGTPAPSRGSRRAKRAADPTPDESPPEAAPLAARMRPRTLDEYVGQEHLLGPGRA